MPLAVIFDLDGCLVESEPLSLEAIAAEMRALGIADARPEDIRDRFLGIAIGVICEHVAARTGRPCPPDFQDRVEARLFKGYEKHLAVVAGVPEVLVGLRADRVITGIATGGSLRRMAKTLDCSGLAEVFAGHSFSADEVARGKPAPDLFLHAAARLGMRPDHCVVAEDSPHAIEGALAAGMRAFGFVGGAHLEGIRAAHADKLRKAGALDIFEDMGALSDALHGLVAT